MGEARQIVVGCAIRDRLIQHQMCLLGLIGLDEALYLRLGDPAGFRIQRRIG